MSFYVSLERLSAHVCEHHVDVSLDGSLNIRSRDVNDSLTAAARRNGVVAQAEHVSRHLVAHVHVRLITDALYERSAGLTEHDIRQSSAMRTDHRHSGVEQLGGGGQRRAGSVREHGEVELTTFCDRLEYKLDRCLDGDTTQSGPTHVDQTIPRGRAQTLTQQPGQQLDGPGVREPARSSLWQIDELGARDPCHHPHRVDADHSQHLRHLGAVLGSVDLNPGVGAQELDVWRHARHHLIHRQTNKLDFLRTLKQIGYKQTFELIYRSILH